MSKKDREYSLLAASVGGGGVLVMANRPMPPLPCFLIWVGLLVAFLFGSAVIVKPGIRIVICMAATYIAFSLWHITSQHARIEVLNVARAFDPNAPTMIVNVDYQNSGQYEATLSTVAASMTGLLVDTADASKRAELEKEIHNVVRNIHPEDVDLVPAGAKRLSSIERNPYMTSNDLQDFENEKTVFYADMQISYTDWWQFGQTAEVCIWFRASERGVVHNCSKYNSW